MPSVPPDPARLAQAPDPGLGARVSVQLERTVDAPIERVWALLRDYRLARPRLLSEHFSDYAVHHGGEGAGTVLEYQLRAPIFDLRARGRASDAGGSVTHPEATAPRRSARRRRVGATGAHGPRAP